MKAASSQALEARLAQIARIARSAGLKLTPQRLAIVRELAGDPSHPTAQELFERLRPELPTMSFATVYNTLDTLADAGLCSALSLSPGPARFDANMVPHDHAVCDRCGQVRDVAHGSTASRATALASNDRRSTAPPSSSPARTRDAAPAPSTRELGGFAVRAVEVTYRGLCRDCVTTPLQEPSG